MNIEKEELERVINISKSKSEVCRRLGLHNNGATFKKLNRLIEEYDLDTSNFPKNKNHYVKYKRITKKCPVCENEFETKKGHKKEKKTCSHACSNTYFRSGVDNPNWKNSSYRSTCFLYHEKKCVICGEDKILDVHHFDENKENNSPENLIPLCPTHHMYWHSRYKDEIYDKVCEYRESFIINLGMD